MTTNGTLDRQIRLLRMLSSRRLGVTVEELRDEFNVSGKTIRRDLDRFRQAGFPLDQTTEVHGRRRWRMASDSITGSGLCFDEAFALLFAAGAIGSLDDTAIGESIRSAVKKLRSGLSENVIDYCDRLGRAFALTHPRLVDYGNKTEIIEQLLLGREEHRNVFIAYHSRNATEPVSYGVSPYALRLYQNSMYLIGYSDHHDAVRTFKLDRIGEAETTEVRFAIPAGFDADAYLSTGFGIYGGETSVPVHVRFSATAARALSESQWHTSQCLEPQNDGTTVASYQVAITPELVGWLLSIGKDATVLGPPELIQQIKQQAKQIAANYTEAKSEKR